MARAYNQSLACARQATAALQSFASSVHFFTSLALSASLSFSPSHVTFTLVVPASPDEVLEQSDSTRLQASSPSLLEQAGKMKKLPPTSVLTMAVLAKKDASFMGSRSFGRKA